MKQYILPLAGVLLVSACAVTTYNLNRPLPTSENFAMASAPISQSQTLSKIAFGSCLKEADDMSIWTDIEDEDPDLFLFLGDNVYGDMYPDDPRFDDPNMPKMRRSYAKLADSRTFESFRAVTPMLTTWDDHDYGVNDGGAEYALKAEAEALFLDAWDIPEDDVRRTRPGIYSSHSYGPEGQRVQIIMLDTRYFRGPLTETNERNAKGKERYLPSIDTTSTMLGETQWAWLADELSEPADLRLLVSSIQVIAEGHGWEAWRTLPHERERLYQVLKDTGTVGQTVIISGDRHAGAIYKRDIGAETPIYEITSSSLNAPVSAWRKPGDTYVEPGPHRLTTMQNEVNYGVANIDWEAGSVQLQVISPGNETFEASVSFR